MTRIARRLAGLVLAGCYAGLALASGLDRISEFRPDAAGFVPEPFRVNAARALAVDALKARRFEAALVEARLALIRDPADARSAGQFGSVMLASGDPEGARAAFTLSAALGWRDAPTQLFWMAQALDAGDVKTASQRLDALLRQDPRFEQRQQLLALLEASRAGREQLVARLADEPAWRTNYYLDSYLLTPEAVSNRAEVAEELARSAGVRDCQLVAPITFGLVSQKDFATARRVWDLHCRPEDEDGNLADGGFDRASLIKPTTVFDWSWYDDSMIGVSLQPAVGFSGPAVTVGTTAPAPRRFAAQLVLLEPGSYRASWRAQTLTGEPAGGIGLSLACDKDTVKPVSAALEDAKLGRFAANFAVPPGCPAQWLTFSIAPGSGDAVLDDVAVTEP